MVEIEETVVLDIEEVELSSRAGGDERMDSRTDDEDVSTTPANRMTVY